MLFMKPLDAVIGPGAPIIYPHQGQNVHYEGELAAVIGKTARRVSERMRFPTSSATLAATT